MLQARAREFVQYWPDAWNGHDLGAVRAHCANAVTFTFPVVGGIAAGPDGVVCGGIVRGYGGPEAQHADHADLGST